MAIPGPFCLFPPCAEKVRPSCPEFPNPIGMERTEGKGGEGNRDLYSNPPILQPAAGRGKKERKLEKGRKGRAILGGLVSSCRRQKGEKEGKKKKKKSKRKGGKEEIRSVSHTKKERQGKRREHSRRAVTVETLACYDGLVRAAGKKRKERKEPKKKRKGGKFQAEVRTASFSSSVRGQGRKKPEEEKKGEKTDHAQAPECRDILRIGRG